MLIGIERVDAPPPEADAVEESQDEEIEEENPRSWRVTGVACAGAAASRIEKLVWDIGRVGDFDIKHHQAVGEGGGATGVVEVSALLQ